MFSLINENHNSRNPDFFSEHLWTSSIWSYWRWNCPSVLFCELHHRNNNHTTVSVQPVRSHLLCTQTHFFIDQIFKDKWKINEIILIIFHICYLQLRVRAYDNGIPSKSNTSLVEITINRNLNAPIFVQTQLSANLPDNNALGQTLITVTANDADTAVGLLINCFKYKQNFEYCYIIKVHVHLTCTCTYYIFKG